MPRFRFILLLTACEIFASCLAANAAEDGGFISVFTALDQNRWRVADGYVDGDYQACQWRADHVSTARGDLELRLSDQGGRLRAIGCAEVSTSKRFGYGLYEARLRSAAGSGLNTGFFTYVGPPNGVPEWDEIDFEFLGKAPRTVSINHFTNGKAEGARVVQLGFDASKEFHNYAFEWMPNKIRWYVDGKIISETPAGSQIPRNPGALCLSLWSGAKAENAWMGPFQYAGTATAEVAWAAYTPPGAPCKFPESLRCNR